MSNKITVYMPNYKYGKYLNKSISSVLNQTYKNWELIIIQEEKDEYSLKIIRKYLKKYPKKIKLILNKKKLGLRKCSNLAILKSKGQFLLRLDADDYLNENCLLLLRNEIIKDKKIGLVYSDFIYVDQFDNFLEVNTYEKIKKKNPFYGTPAHGACSLIRKKILQQVNKYDDTLNFQDGYEIWLKIIKKYKIKNICTPLFYYRQHNNSMSKDFTKIINERIEIKKKIIGNQLKNLKICAVIGAKSYNNLILENLNKRKIIEYTLKETLKCKLLDKILVSTESKKVAKFVQSYNHKFITQIRNNKDYNTYNTRENITQKSIQFLKKKYKYSPDIIVFLNSKTPFITNQLIEQSLNALILFKSDEVISVYEDFDLHFQNTSEGLRPISNRRHISLKVDREALYVDNRFIYTARKNLFNKKKKPQKMTGYIVMPRDRSFVIQNKSDIHVAEALLNK